MIKAVLFDMDETILDRQASLVRFAATQYSRHRSVLRPISLIDYIKRFLTLDDNGRLWKDEVYRRILSEAGLDVGLASTLLEEYVEEFRHHCITFTGVELVLADLRKRGIQMGIITNGPYPFQLRNFEALGLDEFFEVVLVSEQEKISKPNPQIFMRALERMGVDPGDAIFVGDNPQADIGGAQAAGMRAVWIRSFYWPDCPHADGAIEAISELPDLLDRLHAD